ncbi:MAG: hypothetical protein ACI9S8_003178 [Chlamydiales bacterium]|jgi:hypothetical protein
MSITPCIQSAELRNKFRPIEQEHLGTNHTVLWGRLRSSISSCYHSVENRCMKVATPIILGLGAGIFGFHAYCTVQGSIPLFEEMGASIIDPDNWPKLGGEVPEWFAEIPSEAWFTALAYLAITGSGTAAKIRSQLSNLLRPLVNKLGPKSKMESLEDMALTTHLATRTGIFSQPFCDIAQLQYHKLAFNPDDSVSQFLDGLHQRLGTRGRECSKLDPLLVVAGLTCATTSIGSAWGTAARFCEGFDLSGGTICKTYPVGEREIRLGHYREWFVNTIVFAVSYFVIQDRINNEKSLKNYQEICNNLLDEKSAELSEEEYFAIKEYLENELEKVVKYCVFNKDPADYLLGNLEQMKVIQNDLNKAVKDNTSWGNIAKNASLYLAGAGTLGFINYLFIMGFTHEIPEVEEHFGEGYYLDHAIGENAEWAFLFATNVLGLMYKLPQFLYNRSKKEALENVLDKENLKALLDKHSDNRSDLYRILEHSLRRISGKTPLEARARLSGAFCTPDLNSRIENVSAAEFDRAAIGEYNRLLRDIDAVKFSPFESRTQAMLLTASIFTTAVGLASGYGATMNLLHDFSDAGYQGEAAEYFWNLLAFCYSGMTLYGEAKNQSAFKSIKKVMVEFLSRVSEENPELAKEFHKILEKTLKEQASRLNIKQQPSKTHLHQPSLVEIAIV